MIIQQKIENTFKVYSVDNSENLDLKFHFNI
jgi:hypothetical protein